MSETYDVVIAGSGAAGMAAAVRAQDLGLTVLVLEKAHKFGGTSATSGGVLWIPNHGLGTDDSREETMRYLDGVIGGPVRRDRLEAFVDEGPNMVRYLQSIGMQLQVMPWSDYFSEAAGARADRSLVCPMYDGRKLGRELHVMREQFTRFKLLNRYTMDFGEAFGISSKAPGWKRQLACVVGRYWADLGTRGVTRRDRLLSLGGALIGPMRKRLLDRGVEVRLGATVKALEVTHGRVTGVEIEHLGQRRIIGARHGVVVCAGGFEWNQELRNHYFSLPGDTTWSSTPEEANRGEVLQAGLDIGADVEFMETGWWVPTMRRPIDGVSNFDEIHQAVFDVGRPHSVCVNRNGDRFVDEACGYDRFGNAMIQDQLKTGMNAPCWLVFDAAFRRKFTAGGYMPSPIMPDRKIAPDHWDHYIFKAPTVVELAKKIALDPGKLQQVVAKMNEYARTGVDPEFGRGSTDYDRSFGDATVKPNPNLGPIDQAPFYAIQINLGDLGTKGGLKADARARVLDTQGRPIPGLYAAGNASGSPFGNCYPGAGGTIGPAMVFGYIAANDIAEHARAARLTSQALTSVSD
ncbi:FAD-dependent oxidoreductase [Trinickia violacea]|uniref:FAD-dependent oxidoreductase n=1 Tax=Trinickia violacea TaxID=2571746 RepID=A0A4P8IMY4_9BURK|nr:FAD-dependent oxidoreductase [Trinickia violacea]QCP50358.1 FAD-dependent oxidoreductase [Trinickia violacea]